MGSRLTTTQNDDAEDDIIRGLRSHFGTKVKDFVVKESTNQPFRQVVLEMTLYNYFVVRAVVEKNTLSFAIVQSGFLLPLVRDQYSGDGLQNTIKQFDLEARLRIPDKYLQSKDWL